MSDLLCTGCIIDAKLSGTPVREAIDGGAVREAVAFLNGTSVCLDHIIVQQPSAVVAPDGSQILVTR